VGAAVVVVVGAAVVVVVVVVVVVGSGGLHISVSPTLKQKSSLPAFSSAAFTSSTGPTKSASSEPHMMYKISSFPPRASTSAVFISSTPSALAVSL
jgi:hypothetical protein